MTFQAASHLWALALVGLVAGLYLAVHRRRTRYAVRFTNVALLDRIAPRHPGWRRHLTAVLFAISMAAFVVAFARPTHNIAVPTDKATVMVAVDTSLSMAATDVSPTRLRAAQAAANQFVDAIPASLNVGLVSFHASASVLVEPTTDRSAVRTAISRLQLGEGTAIGEAIFASLDAIRTVDPSGGTGTIPARVVLMSDGATNTGRPNDQAAQAAVAAHVPIETIAFGTDHGTVTVPGSPSPVDVPVDKAALQAIADTTGGHAYAAATEQELTAVYQGIGSAIGYTTAPRELTTWFTGTGLIIMLITAGASLLWFNRLP
jgi:Ca-activated chloride channel homolog